VHLAPLVQLSRWIIRLQDSSKKKRLHSKNTSAGYRGVRKNGKSKMSFQAQIQIDNKLKYLGTGTHETPKEAALAFDRAVVKHKLSSSKLNYPDGLPIDDEDYEAITNPKKYVPIIIYLAKKNII
jgi:hypothetical protein